MIRVLIAEDSAVTRDYLTHLLHEDPELEVAGLARNGREAVDQAERLRPDVVLMDIHMPEMDGYEATRQIMARTPTPIIIVSASYKPDDVSQTFAALQAGALTAIEKPEGMTDARQPASARQLVQTVKLMAEVKVVRRRRPPAPARPLKATGSAAEAIGAIAIGASTGGPPVVAEILRQLPRALLAPVLLVQHIAPGFVNGLVDWLQRDTALHVKLAEPAERMEPATVYVAPDGFQLGVTKLNRIRLATEPGGNGFCPSASHLFASVAEAYGQNAIGVLLTGMGTDGADGLLTLRRAGAVTIAQDKASCTVFGMPGEAIRLGAAIHTLSPADIGQMIAALASTERSVVNGRVS